MMMGECGSPPRLLFVIYFNFFLLQRITIQLYNIRVHTFKTTFFWSLEWKFDGFKKRERERRERERERERDHDRSRSHTNRSTMGMDSL